MKKISLLFAFVLLLASCTENNLITPDPNSLEGVHTSIGLSVAPMQGDAIATKGDAVFTKSQSGFDENSVKSLWTLQFSNTGTLLKKSYILVENLSKVDILLAAATGSNIYFVANVSQASLASFAGTETDYKAAVATFASELGVVTAFDGVTKCIPMSGVLTNQVVTEFGIAGGVTVSLTRMLARIDVKCTLGTLAMKAFSLQQVRLVNVPKSVRYFDAQLYPESPAAPTSLMDFTLEAAAPSTTYTFYVPENLCGIGTNTGTDASPKNKTGKAGATYIELSGLGKGGFNGGSISFTLYPGGNVINNYDIKRNNSYAATIDLLNVRLSDLRFAYLPPESNCYIIAPGGKLAIPTKRASNALLPDAVRASTSDLNAATASIYWEAGPIIKTNNPATSNQIVRVENGGSCANGTFTVTGVSKGNAVVCIKNTSGKILWSWHIWVSDVDFTSSDNTLTTTSGGISYTWMDRNLGALDVAGTAGATYATTAGMFYQWGRKDPFWPAVTDAKAPMPIAGGQNILGSYTQLASTPVGNETYLKSAILGDTAPYTYANQLALSVQFPALFLTGWAGSAATLTAGTTAEGGKDSWNGDTFGLGKSVYDPCPVGWYVPSYYKTAASTSPWAGMLPGIQIYQSAGDALYKVLTNASYADWGTNSGAPINYGKYPITGYRSSNYGELSLVDGVGECWSGTVNGASGFNLCISIDRVKSSDSTPRAYGLPVRCVQE